MENRQDKPDILKMDESFYQHRKKKKPDMTGVGTKPKAC